jgi:hypothetical protein
MGALDVSCGVDTGNASPFLLAAENVALPHPHCVDASPQRDPLQTALDPATASWHGGEAPVGGVIRRI